MVDTSTSDAAKKPPKEIQPENLAETDFDRVAENICDELSRRVRDRIYLEKQWKEVDRQIRMEPIQLLTPDGRPMRLSSWFPEMELPKQAQTLEVLTADARRLIFPDNRNWFRAHCSMEDDKLEALETKNIIPGLDEEAQTLVEGVNQFAQAAGKRRVDQADLDALVEGVHTTYHSYYDYRLHWDLLNAEAFKYGTFVFRAKRVRLDKTTNDFRGVYLDTKRIPVLIPRTIKNTYLDDQPPKIMNEGIFVAPSFIETYWQNLDDLRMAAAKGSSDPKNENGGWRAAATMELEPISKTRRIVQLIEFEGDLIVTQALTKSLFIPNIIVTVAYGKGTKKIVRWREREFDFRSYCAGAYHRQDVDSPYGTSPLIMGAPIQKGATEVFGRMLQTSALNAEPPTQWSPLDHYLAATGGPNIEPGAKWQAQSKIEVYHQIGNPEALSRIFAALVIMYEEVTGVSLPRLGGQTKSHQTAFAVDSEITRGVIRTVDYVMSTMNGALPTYLNMELEMARKSLKNDLVYVPQWKQYVRLSAEDLPERVTYDVYGAAGPVERRERAQRIMQALQMVIALEPVAEKLGGKPLDINGIREFILHEAQIYDTDKFFAQAASVQPPVAAPGNPALSQGIAPNVPVSGAPEMAPGAGAADNLIRLAAAQRGAKL